VRSSKSWIRLRNPPRNMSLTILERLRILREVEAVDATLVRSLSEKDLEDLHRAAQTGANIETILRASVTTV